MDVRDSLRRADFDKRYGQGAPSDPHENTGEIRTAVGGRDHTAHGKSEGRLRVRMPDLIAAGVINPPVEIEVTFKGERLTATIDHDGLIHFDGETYSSPSRAAGIARNKVNGPPSDGRAHWQTNGRSCRKRRQAKLQEVKAELRRRMHQPTAQTGKWLAQVVRGSFVYHAVPGNVAALAAFRYHVMNLWRRTLRRRSQKDAMTWTAIARLADCWLPKPLVLHPWPLHRFAVRHPR